MPELPEVETVCRGLIPILVGRTLHRVVLTRTAIRTPIPPDFAARLTNQRVVAIRRRAKFILIDTPEITALCHLGMTGTWRVAPLGDERAHDHCYFELDNSVRLAFRDPRRFGQLDLIEPGTQHPSLARLGPEPLSADFSASTLHARLRGRKQAIKALIMDQAIVVGVGNIYAQEACYRAGILPTMPAGKISLMRLERLVSEIRTVLTAAINAGGSTISDFRQAGGDNGYFQHDFRVYGRSGSACSACGTTLRGGTIAGRTTTWCPRCQRS